MDKKDILEIFERTGAILRGHFLLTSGRHSDTYMQCAKLFVEPKLAKALCEELCEKLKGVEVDLVASPAVGGIIMGYQMAQILSTKNLFFERQDGVMALRRGFAIEKGAKVLVVEDVVTMGGSVREVIEQCKKRGADVRAVASIVDRSGGKVDFGLPFYSLLSMDIISYEAGQCPLCERGIPAVKPGSRDLK
jgi:orotate phosphoribosyltransferase